MKWDDFLSLVTDEAIGFGVNPKGGSYVQIIYGAERSQTGRGHFTLHKPHGPGRKERTLGPNTLRSIREYLAEDFGWTYESFRSK